MCLSANELGKLVEDVDENLHRAHPEVSGVGDRHRRLVAGQPDLPAQSRAATTRRMDLIGGLLASTGSENIRLVVGGVPYQAVVIEMDGLSVGYEGVVLLEDVGNPSGCPTGEDEVCYVSGALVVGRHAGRVHEATGERLLEYASFEEAIGSSDEAA